MTHDALEGLKALEDRLVEIEGAIDRVRAVRLRTRRRLLATTGALLFALGSGWTIIAATTVQGTAVFGPFAVVDGNGKQILAITAETADPTHPGGADTNRLVLDNQAGASLAEIGASADRSWFDVGTADSATSVELGTDGDSPYLQIFSKGSDEPRLSLDVTDGKAKLELFAPDGHGVLRLNQGASGGGELEIAKPGGDVVVRAGISPAGTGRVEAYPLGNPLGSAIVGKVPGGQ